MVQRGLITAFVLLLTCQFLTVSAASSSNLDAYSASALNLSNSRVGHLARQLRIQRPIMSIRDLILDEVSPGNISERQSRQRITCFSSHIVIGCPADVQITLLNSLASTNI